MIEQFTNSLQLIILQTQTNFRYLIIILLILWGVFFLNLLLGYRLFVLGIIPRKSYGLFGIVCAPLLHANFNHLFFNSIPLIVLSNFLLMQGLPYYMHMTFLLTILSGILIWCFAKPGIHIGASSVITGYWGLLVADIYQQGTLTAIILGLICLYYFAGIFFGIFPQKKGVSWEGHLFGLIAAIPIIEVYK